MAGNSIASILPVALALTRAELVLFVRAGAKEANSRRQIRSPGGFFVRTSEKQRDKTFRAALLMRDAVEREEWGLRQTILPRNSGSSRWLGQYELLKPVTTRAWPWRVTVCILGALVITVISRKAVVAVNSVRVFPSIVVADTGPRVLFVVRTCPKYYNTRLRDVLETHIRDVPARLILAVGNTPFTMAVIESSGTLGVAARVIHVMPTDGSNSAGVGVCDDNHGTGITCIEGRALYYAYERRQDFDWIFVADDDVYVHHKNLRIAILKLDEDERLVYTVGGCAPKVACAREAGGGICGGGGWLMSKENLVRVIEHDGGNGSAYTNSSMRLLRRKQGKQTDLAAWMEAWMETGAAIAKEDGSWWSDITAGCVMHERGGVFVKNMPGLHPWTLDRKSLHLEIAKQSPPPLSYHYVGRDEMPGMREMHEIMRSTSGAEPRREESTKL